MNPISNLNFKNNTNMYWDYWLMFCFQFLRPPLPSSPGISPGAQVPIARPMFTGLIAIPSRKNIISFVKNTYASSETRHIIIYAAVSICSPVHIETVFSPYNIIKYIKCIFPVATMYQSQLFIAASLSYGDLNINCPTISTPDFEWAGANQCTYVYKQGSSIVMHGRLS